MQTPSLFSSKLLKLFAQTQPFEERKQKSLWISSTSSVQDSASNSSNQITEETYELYYLKGKLEVNPDDYDTIRDVVTVCSLTFRSVPEDDFQLSIGLLQAIQTSGCSVKACPATSCWMDTSYTYYNCDCDIVVGLDDLGKTFIASVAYLDRYQRVSKDIEFLGIYQQIDDIEKDTSLLGFPLNSPDHPLIIPKFEDLEQFANLIVQSLGLGLSVTNFDVSVVNVPENDPDALFNLLIDFTISKEMGVSFDGSVGIGGKLTQFFWSQVKWNQNDN